MMLGPARKKIALVDVDGTLLIGGELNTNLLKHLKEGGYDQIWLFTQRAAFLTRDVCLLALRSDLTDPETIAFQSTLTGVKTALEGEGLHITGVSTSFDLPLGHNPGEYYTTTLKDLDPQIASYLALWMSDRDSAPPESITKIFEEEDKEEFFSIVKNKNMQMTTLLQHIQRLTPTASNAEIIFFDDHPGNFAQMHEGMASTKSTAAAAAAASAGGTATTVIPEGMTLNMVLATERKTAGEYTTEIARQKQLPYWFLRQAQIGEPVASALISQIMRMSDARVTLVADALAKITSAELGEACERSGLIGDALCKPTTIARSAFCFLLGGEPAHDYLTSVLNAKAEAKKETASFRLD